jgi:beta-aspartyl-dipeptidase (metallo-type)
MMLELLLNADLYAPKRLGHRHLLVAAGRIAWIGGEIPELKGVPVNRTDAEGRRVIPGLVDGHVHLTGGGGEAGPESRVPSPALGAFTRSGITSVLGLLGTDDNIRSPEELLVATLALRRLGLSAWCLTGGYHLPPRTVTGSVRSDLVLIEPVLGVGEVAISDHRSSQPTLDVLLATAAEAHVGGLLGGKAGILHLHVGDGPRGLSLIREALAGSELPARVFNPTHVNRRKALLDEATELAREGAVVDVTAFPVAEGEDAWPASVALSRYLESGAPAGRITVSSDAGGSLPVFDAAGQVATMDAARPRALLDALRETLEAGLPLDRALPAFTLNPATHWGLAGKGRLETGADADLVVLDHDGAAAHVMARGRWHVRDGKAIVKSPLENGQ